MVKPEETRALKSFVRDALALSVTKHLVDCFFLTHKLIFSMLAAEKSNVLTPPGAIFRDAKMIFSKGIDRPGKITYPECRPLEK